MKEIDYDKVLFERAATMLRVQGIIAIIFGSLGSLMGLVLMVLFALGVQLDTTPTSPIEGVVFAIITLVFMVLPHIYLIVAGTVLVRGSQPAVARTLTIINLIVGSLSNMIVLVFAIISLTQSGDYERHFKRVESK